MRARTDHSRGSPRMHCPKLSTQEISIWFSESVTEISAHPCPFLSLYLTDVSARGARSQKSLSLPHPASSHPTSDLSPNLLSSLLKYTQILTSSHLPSCRPHPATPISQRKYHTECLCLPAPAHNTASPPQPGGSFKKRESVGNGAATLANSLTAPQKATGELLHESTPKRHSKCVHRETCA